jgi:uncharacterized phiE125 gp8 family phage protein
MAGLLPKTLPSEEPVTLEEAILYARYEIGTEADATFQSLIKLAREQTEAITEHQLNTATFIQYFDGWKDSWNRCFLLDKPPLQTVTAVKYIDTDGTEQTVDPNNYIVHNQNQHRGIIQFKNEYTFPELREEQYNSVNIEFVCGYEDYPVPPLTARGVPETLRDAMLLFINDTWSHREYQLDGKITGSIQNNKIAMQILGSYRVLSPTGIGAGSEVPQYIL